MTPRISVLMPCFNQGAFIGEAIDSVLAQTFQDFEIIVVDDGSTDPLTQDTLSQLATPRTIVLKTENQGLPSARNHAAGHASGAFLCALDADDKLASTWFEKAVKTLDEQPDVSFVSHWLETFGDEHWAWKPERCDLPALLARNTVNGAAIVRREAFDAVGGYDESMRDGCEDWDFWLRLVERGFAGTIIPDVLFYYRRRAASMSREMLDEQRYRRPLETLIAKHEEAYRRHLPAILAAKEAEAQHLVREIATIEHDRVLSLEPARRRAREELAAVARKAERARGERAREEEHERLRWKAAELEREVAAVRASWSWRLTAPLRTLYSIVRGRS
ncbi:MAG: glycosyltransferase family 2 protein [Vicinamibacterales bacterium]